MMKIYLLKLLTLFLIIYSLGSCRNPIFYTVTQETPLIPPLIDGSPSNFAILNNEMFVASGKTIFNFNENNKNNNGEIIWKNWQSLDNFNENEKISYVAGLATTDNSLYALCLINDKGKIRRYYKEADSYKHEDFNGPKYNFQSIYTSGNVLFACVRNDDRTYTVFYKEEGADFIEIPPIKIPLENSNFKTLDYILNGVASDSNYYYLCTYSGIFYVEIVNINSSAATILKNEEDKAYTGFTGIINLNGNYVAAINKNGDLYEINDAKVVKKASFNDRRESTGALAIWKDKDQTKSLLLVGRSEYYYSTISRYTNGYVEIELDETGIKEGANFREPGGNNSPTTIDNYDRYVSSLGKKIINHFIQMPFAIDEKMTLFASTQKNGVWSYRDHNDGEGETWNAEK